MHMTTSARIGILFTIFSLACLISGCVSIGARVIGAVYADPRTKNHAYYSTVKMSFTLRGRKIVATRYAETWFLTGGTSHPWPLCNQDLPHCWFSTGHFFAALPNGDMVDIFIDHSGTSLAHIAVDEPIHLTGRIAGIYRDQPDHRVAKELGPCQRLDEETSGVAVTVEVTRKAGSSLKTSVLDPEDIYKSMSFDGVSCSRVIQRIKGQTTIEAG